jgi:importin-4
MPLVLKELASSDATNRRNAAFCAGEICKNGGAAALKYVFFFSRIIIFDDARK